LNDLNGFETAILPFIQNSFGKSVLEGYASLIQNSYPWYFEELKGLSDGTQIEFNWVNKIRFFVKTFSYY
jgi:hypothetical protein